MIPVDSSVDWIAIVDEYQANWDNDCHEAIDFWIEMDRDYVNASIKKQWDLPLDFSDFTSADEEDDVPF